MSFSVSPAGLPDALVITPAIYRDARGWFSESWNEREFAAATGLDLHFVQDNHSCSARNVLRGLHYQIGTPQGRLIRRRPATAFTGVRPLERTRAVGRQPPDAVGAAGICPRLPRPRGKFRNTI